MVAMGMGDGCYVSGHGIFKFLFSTNSTLVLRTFFLFLINDSFTTLMISPFTNRTGLLWRSTTYG